MSAVLNTGALAGKVVFVTGASRGIGSDIQFIVAVLSRCVFSFRLSQLLPSLASKLFSSVNVCPASIR